MLITSDKFSYQVSYQAHIFIGFFVIKQSAAHKVQEIIYNQPYKLNEFFSHFVTSLCNWSIHFTVQTAGSPTPIAHLIPNQHVTLYMYDIIV